MERIYREPLISLYTTLSQIASMFHEIKSLLYQTGNTSYLPAPCTLDDVKIEGIWSKTLNVEHVGYPRSGFEYFLEGFAPFHFPVEITTSQIELEELYRLHYFFFYTKHLQTPKICKNSKERFKSRSNFVKTVVILPETLSYSFIHFPNRTRRALSIPLLFFYTKHRQT